MHDMTSALSFALEPSSAPVPSAARRDILDNPGFGKYFTDHMVTVMWTPDDGWHDARVHPYGPLSLDPAAAVLHYAQEIFEGMKAYAHPDDSVWTFRPEANAKRFQGSARRLALPELPTDWFVDSVDQLVRTDRAWVPRGAERSPPAG